MAPALLLLLLSSFIAIASSSATVTGQPSGGVTCEYVSIPTLTAIWPFKVARVCRPSSSSSSSSSPAPLHVFCHADFGGGPMSLAYNRLQEQIASYGFVVAEYVSCAIDQECVNGEAQFVEALKTVVFLRNATNGPWAKRVDWSRSWSTSGHSTGARAVLMLAAVRDSPDTYLKNMPKITAMMTSDMREVLSTLGAVVSDHPDMMYLSRYNPDIAHYNITATPIMILTGSKDTTIEAQGSAWHDFRMLQTQDKVFVDVAGADHSEPVEGHRGGPFIAAYAQFYALGNATAGEVIFGAGPASMQRRLPIAAAGQPNLGNGTVSFLACRKRDALAVPAAERHWCGFS